MEKVIIGSTAIKHWFPTFLREPKDLDYVVNIKDMWTKEKGVEYLENDVIYLQQVKYAEDGYLTPNALYTLKISHAFWELNNGTWDKHIFDINFLRNKGCEFIPELFYELFEQWQGLHGKRKSSDLEMSAQDFFDNALPKEHDHDHLHELLITHPYFEGQERPTYTKVLVGEVEVSEEKFQVLSEKEKYNLIFEEVAVMAWEKGRFPPDMLWKRKYSRMLKKFLLYHCPIFSGIWILQNYYNLAKPPFNFQNYLNDAVRTKINQPSLA